MWKAAFFFRQTFALCDVSLTFDDAELQGQAMAKIPKRLPFSVQNAPAGAVCSENGNLLGIFAPPVLGSYAATSARVLAVVASIPRHCLHLEESEWEAPPLEPEPEPEL
jgi:hypothetical protein